LNILSNHYFQNLSITIKKKNIELISKIKIDSNGNYLFTISFFNEKEEVDPLLIDINIIRDFSKEYSYHLTKLIQENLNISRFTLKDLFLKLIYYIRNRDDLYYTKKLLKFCVCTIKGFNLQIYAISSSDTNHNLSTLVSSTLLDHISSTTLLKFHAYNVYFVFLLRSTKIKYIFNRIKFLVKVLRIFLVIVPGIIQSILEYKTNMFTNDFNLFLIITSFTIGSTIILPIVIPRLYQRNQISKILEILMKELI